MGNKTGTEMAIQLSDFFNGAGKKEREEFVNAMVFHVHRTIQQRTMLTFVELIRKYASLTPGQYDLRNLASVDLCKRIIERVEDNFLRLPYI